ncbi:MAG: DUF6883 domain-containing protein [Solirubrobacteraceae bacterium]
MPYPEIGQPLPRASDAYATAEKWRGWILAEHGHGPEWASIFDIEPEDSERIWTAITDAIADALVSTLRDRRPHGVVCGMEVELTINDRTAAVATAWHYAHEGAPPRFVTAYPRP